jgi:hypothetical protein
MGCLTKIRHAQACIVPPKKRYDNYGRLAVEAMQKSVSPINLARRTVLEKRSYHEENRVHATQWSYCGTR